LSANYNCDAAGQDLRKIGANPDYWYPAAWSDELKTGKTLARQFGGEPIVLYRGQSGQVFALEDRCAHRQVPLHLGVVAGDALKCGYHGWTYDCVGRCVNVPYLGADHLPNGVRPYPCREVDGLIFIFPGNLMFADRRVPSALGAAMDSGYKTRRLNREVNAHYTFMHENLMDMNHQFLHRRQMGSIRAHCLGQRSGEDWCEVDYTFSRPTGTGPLGEMAILGTFRPNGGGDNKDLMTIRTGYPYQDLKVWVGTGEPVLHVWLGYMPMGPAQDSSRVFGYLSVRRPKIPGIIEVAWPIITWFTEKIFTEDKRIVELEQEAHDRQGADWNQEVFPAIRDLRAVLSRCGTSPRPFAVADPAEPIPMQALA
jgi:phenylpropionate dioxygenase-like ring-hydroxylating dioxygenase large terminal subunit